MQDNNPPREIKNMTAPHLKKSIGRSPLRLGFFLPALAVACFALMPFAQSAQAVSPEPNEGDLIGNMAEEDDAVAELGSDTVEAAMGQAANTPNKREIQIKITKPLQCAGGNVILSGKVVVTFRHPEVGLVLPHSVKLTGFKGTAVAGNRALQAKNFKWKWFDRGDHQKEKERSFNFEFLVTGPGIGAAPPLRFLVRYTNTYEWEKGNVTKFFPDNSPTVRCR